MPSHLFSESQKSYQFTHFNGESMRMVGSNHTNYILAQMMPAEMEWSCHPIAADSTSILEGSAAIFVSICAWSSES